MKLYIAAPWTRREDARAAALQFIDAGYEITSRWLTTHGDGLTKASRAKEAMEDCFDVERSDVLILLNLEVSEGKAVEQGIAITLDIPIIGIGTPGPQIFHDLPGYIWVPSVDAALTALVGLRFGRR